MDIESFYNASITIKIAERFEKIFKSKKFKVLSLIYYLFVIYYSILASLYLNYFQAKELESFKQENTEIVNLLNSETRENFSINCLNGAANLRSEIKHMHSLNMDYQIISITNVLVIAFCFFRIFLFLNSKIKSIIPIISSAILDIRQRDDFAEEFDDLSDFKYIWDFLVILCLVNFITIKNFIDNQSYKSLYIFNHHNRLLLFLILPNLILEPFFIFIIIVFYKNVSIIDHEGIITPEEESYFENESIECCICYGGLSKGEVQKRLKCGHIYHSECIDSWLKIENLCPMCKQTLIGNGSLRELLKKDTNLEKAIYN